MKKIVLGILGVLVLGGGAGGAYFYLYSDVPDQTKIIGPAYWGPMCELSPTGFVICSNESGPRFDTCSTNEATYRLKVSVTEPRYHPVSLEVWTESPRRYNKLISGDISSEGTGGCYFESYLFNDAGILINKGSNCGHRTQANDELNLMFYVSDDSGSISACKISDTKPPEEDQ